MLLDIYYECSTLFLFIFSWSSIVYCHYCASLQLNMPMHHAYLGPATCVCANTTSAYICLYVATIIKSITSMQNITVPVSVTAYNVSFLSPSGTIISSKAITNPCQDSNCSIESDVLFLCSSSPSINFTVSAVNSFGQGPPTNVNTIGNIHPVESANIH